jgi:hypothetical protein
MRADATSVSDQSASIVDSNRRFIDQIITIQEETNDLILWGLSRSQVDDPVDRHRGDFTKNLDLRLPER